MKRIKLLSRTAIKELQERLNMGVPLSTAIVRLELNISRPTVKKILSYAESSKFDNSIFPPWLEECPKVQEKPDDWRYIGYFPLGEWQQCKDS